MADDRALRGEDVVHMSLVSPTGALSQVDTMVTLDDIAAYVLSKMAPVAAAVEPVAEDRPTEGGAL